MSFQSEGRQRKYPHGFALSVKFNDLTSEIFHHIEGGAPTKGKEVSQCRAYIQDRRVAWRLWLDILLGLFLLDPQILHIAPSKHDILIDRV